MSTEPVECGDISEAQRTANFGRSRPQLIRNLEGRGFAARRIGRGDRFGLHILQKALHLVLLSLRFSALSLSILVWDLLISGHFPGRLFGLGVLEIKKRRERGATIKRHTTWVFGIGTACLNFRYLGFRSSSVEI